MWAIYKREMQNYFKSPQAYVFMAAFILLSGFIFSVYNLLTLSSDMSYTFSYMSLVYILIIPILTMRLMSEDRKNKTDQLLLTAPVTLWDVVLGKFLAAVTVLMLTLAVSLVFVVIIGIFGIPSYGEIFAAYFGFFLLGMALVALGIFLSSLTDSMVTAAVSTFAIVFLLYLLDSVVRYIDAEWLSVLIGWLSAYTRFQDFGMGLLSLSGIVYYFSFAGVFLFLTVQTLQKRRWSED